MEKFAIGDKVVRNDTIALYPEDVFPSDMEFNHTYVIRAIHSRKIYEEFLPYQFHNC